MAPCFPVKAKVLTMTYEISSHHLVSLNAREEVAKSTHLQHAKTKTNFIAQFTSAKRKHNLGAELLFPTDSNCPVRYRNAEEMKSYSHEFLCLKKNAGVQIYVILWQQIWVETGHAWPLLLLILVWEPLTSSKSFFGVNITCVLGSKLSWAGCPAGWPAQGDIRL